MLECAVSGRAPGVRGASRQVFHLPVGRLRTCCPPPRSAGSGLASGCGDAVFSGRRSGSAFPSPRCSLSPCLHPFGESDPPSDPGRSSPRGSLSHKILLAAATVPDIVLTSFPTAITLTEAKPGPRNLRRSLREEIPGGQRSGAPSHDPAATATATTRARSPREKHRARPRAASRDASPTTSGAS
jgi:hypothetical protein